MSNKKTLAEEMYEQESRDIERAINTLNKMAEQNMVSKESSSNKETEMEATKIDQRTVILEYLENAYSGAKMMDDVEMMCRLSRAILAFSYDDLEKMPTWEEMQEAYLEK